MLVDRAREIFKSKGVIQVLYQGHPVWIEEIDEDSAIIRMMDSEHQLTVPVNMLTESSQ